MVLLVSGILHWFLCMILPLRSETYTLMDYLIKPAIFGADV